MAVFNVSVLSVAPISGTVTVRAANEKEAIELARDSHRSAQIRWMNGQTRVGAFTGKIDKIWAEETSTGEWLVSMTASFPISKAMSVEAPTRAEAEALALRDVPYTNADDWRYQNRPVSPMGGVRPPIDWSFLAPSPPAPDYVPPTRTILEIIPNPAQETVWTVLSAVVSSNEGVPTGLVTFYKSVSGPDVAVGSDVLTGGHAAVSIQAPSQGLHVYYAVYGGADGFEPSTSPEQTLVVSGAPRGTSTLVTFEANPYIMGASEVDIYATVNGAGTITGTVDFYNGDPNAPGEATFLGTEPVVGNVATYTHSLSGLGSIPIYAVYSGDIDHDPSTSPQATLVVVPEIVITSVTPNSGTESGGTSVTIDGFGLAQVTNVTFNGVQATNVVPNGQFELTCDTPPGTGVADVVAFAYYGNSGASGSNAYTYTASVPTFPPDWVKPSDIAYDGTHLWVTDIGSNRVYKVDPSLSTPNVVGVVDLSTYGVTTTRSVLISGNYIIVLTSAGSTYNVIVINSATNDVVALFQVNSGRTADAVAYDYDNDVLWISNATGNTLGSSSYLSTFDMAAAISSFPTPGTQTAQFGPYTGTNPFFGPQQIAITQIAYGFGTLWGVGAGYGIQGMANIIGFDVGTGAASVLDFGPTKATATANFLSIGSDSIWVTGANNEADPNYKTFLWKFDPGSFMSGASAEIEIFVGAPSFLFPGTPIEEGGSVWIGTADVFGVAPYLSEVDIGSETEVNYTLLPDMPLRGFGGVATTSSYGIWTVTQFGEGGITPGTVWRFDPNTNTFDFLLSDTPELVATIDFTDSARNGGIQEFAFDGTYMWGAHRPWNEGNGSIVKFDPATNAYILNWEGPPGTPLWDGAASIIFDGQYLWVSDGKSVGSELLTQQYIRVVDPTTTPPTLVDSVDISAFAPMYAVRKLRMSIDGQYIFASIKGSAWPSVVPGRVLIIDKTTRTVVGNAELSTANIGFWPPSGCRDAIDTGDGKLWAVNSSQSTQTRIERFDLATILANGTAETSPVSTIDVVNHAEELVYAEGYIWTSGWAYTSTVTRIDPSNDDVSSDLDLSGRYITGLTYAFGWLWAGGFDDNLFRIDPALFGTGNMVTHTINLPSIHSMTVRNGMASDGTHLWVPIREGENNGFGTTGISQQFKVKPGLI